MKKVLALVALLFAAGCATTTQPPIVTPQPPAVVHAFNNVSVYDEADARILDATCSLEHDRDTGEAPVSETSGPNWRHTLSYDEPLVHHLWGAQLTCSSPNYIAATIRIEPLVPNTELPKMVLKGASSWGGESGRLRVAGTRFLTEDGKDWRYRGYTLFLGLEQFCAGMDLDPQVEQAMEDGANSFRVLGMYKPWLGTFTLAVDNPARFDQCLIGLTHYLRDKGARLHFVVFADAQEVMPDHNAQARWFTHIQQLVAGEPTLLGSLCNECEKNGVDPQEFQRPPPSQVLWSRGSGLSRSDPPNPPWDFSEYHEGRGDDYPRLNETRSYMTDPSSPLKGVPVLQDEPMGASERDQPGKRAGAVNGDATQAINDFRQMGANFGLQGPGGLFHSDAGLTGGVMGSVQRQMSKGFYQGLMFAPPDAQTWPYQRGDNCGACPGIGGMPLQQLDAFELRIFCRTQGNSAWCADIRPKRSAIAIPPWRIDAEPAPGLERLVR